MRREFHVRFWEGGGVRFPSATRLVILFHREADARRVLEALPQRLSRYGLTVHPEKTRLMPFRRPRGRSTRSQRPSTFDFLGFTHYWGKSRWGRWVIRRKTASPRPCRALRQINDWLRRHRHFPIADQRRLLSRKLQGHFAYYGITGNSRSLNRIRYVVLRLWRKWLGRRSQRDRMSWTRYQRILLRYPLPSPRIVHSIYRRAANSRA